MDSRGVESKDIIKEDVPVALQTRSRDQLQHPTEAMRSEDLLGRLKIEIKVKVIIDTSVLRIFDDFVAPEFD